MKSALRMEAEDELRQALAGVFKAPVVQYAQQWHPQSSVYEQVVEGIPGFGGDIYRSANKPDSKPPIWTAGWDWVREIDLQVRRWTPALVDASTPLRVDHLSIYTPFYDLAELQYATEVVHGWWRSGFDLLHQNASLDLRASCPVCSASEVFARDTLGETVRRDAIRVSTYGASCESCQRIWLPHELVDLAADLDTFRTPGEVA